ncbi:ATP-binding cassette domain-containing protein [Methanocaldococcus sp.]
MIEIKNLYKEWKDFKLIDVSFKLGNDYLIILGPSGAGKSVLLKCIAGILKPDKGRIYLDGKDITYKNPEERNVGYVPQNYALFPHLNVFKNIAYGLIIKKVSKIEIERKVKEIAELLGISHLLNRKPKTLSGGEQQRVALARALVLNPSILLLDEPTSAVDVNTKEEIINELRKINDIPVIHVTHDIAEARTLAKKIGIFINGKLLEFGDRSILNNPKNLEVAKFLGYNIIDGKIVNPKDIKIVKGKSYKVINVIDYGAYKKVLVEYNNSVIKIYTNIDVDVGDYVDLKI